MIWAGLVLVIFVFSFIWLLRHNARLEMKSKSLEKARQIHEKERQVKDAADNLAIDDLLDVTDRLRDRK